MAIKEIPINGKTCELMKSVRNPKYGSKTVLTDSCWEYVSLFLKRRTKVESREALFYWEQAHSFYLASKNLPDSASPLTSYYCILNATKALLRFKGIEDQKLNLHGISSDNAKNSNINLKNACTVIRGTGVLPELAKYYEYSFQPGQYSISEILYNILCVHRAYCLTFSEKELFVPIDKPLFVYMTDSKEAWLKCEVNKRYVKSNTMKQFPQFEQDRGVPDRYVIRMKKRFKWDIHEPIENRKAKLLRTHEKIRKHIFYIYGETKLWYIKKKMPANEKLEQAPQTVLIFSVFHWLSELVRYDPTLFYSFMKSKQNWLIHEFINKALEQFVDEIGCEITGEDIMCTSRR